jgi:hydroxylamine reductase (hybrid-cluster protein)
MLALPKDTLVLTLGCAKFRLLGYKKEMGCIPNTDIPRLLDVG